MSVLSPSSRPPTPVRETAPVPAADASLGRLAAIAARLADAPLAVLALGHGHARRVAAAADRRGHPAVAAAERLGALVALDALVAGGMDPLVVDDARGAREGGAAPGAAAPPAGAPDDVGAYAGVPIVAAGGAVLGTLCLVDGAPRAWSAAAVEAARTVAAAAATDLALRGALEAAVVAAGARDALTGLQSRARFLELLAHATQRARRGERAALLLLDLDGFTAVNHALGQHAGDRLLALVAERMLHATRGIDHVARLGGDEFAVLLEGVEREEEVQVVADRLLSSVAMPCELPSGVVRVTASAGTAWVESDLAPDDVLRHAGAALAGARAGGTGRLERFTAERHAAERDRRELADDLRSALAREQLHLVYQPIVALDDGRPLGVEALLRWTHPTRGLVPPAAFIPVAEELGLIGAMGRWVLREACRSAAGWPAAEGDAPLSVSVNVSGRQLDDEAFPREVADALAAAGLPAQRLVLEVTETALVRSPRRARRALGELRALGVRIAIDDFGTGYSSLSYLQQLPIDVLKIDRSFVVDAARGAGPSLAFARMIIALGRALGLRAVAEGIETRAQWDALRSLGCERGQGYLFARPLAPDALAAWLRGGAWRAEAAA